MLAAALVIFLKNRLAAAFGNINRHALRGLGFLLLCWNALLSVFLFRASRIYLLSFSPKSQVVIGLGISAYAFLSFLLCFPLP
jgi:hypothetical protein